MTGSSAQQSTRALDAVLPALRCSVCAQELRRQDDRVVCVAHHGFDIARQGYLNLAVGRRAGTADTADMVGHRERFLAAGCYRPIAEALATIAAAVAVPDQDTLVVDLAGGTGYYLAAVLDGLPHRLGVCVDLSTPALRRAARAHPRAAAIGADAWRTLPFADGCVAVLLSVFGPRDAGEIDRVLIDGGALITVSPRPEHLRELIEPLGMIGMDPTKPQREAQRFAGLRLTDDQTLTYRRPLIAAQLVAAAAMGPSAWHVTLEALEARVAQLPDPFEVTVSVRIATYRAPER